MADKEDPKDELLKVKKEKMLTFSEYFQSLTSMPNSLKILFLTNLFTWMSHLSYSLYFTDFVGECVFGGDPKVSIIKYTSPLIFQDKGGGQARQYIIT